MERLLRTAHAILAIGVAAGLVAAAPTLVHAAELCGLDAIMGHRDSAERALDSFEALRGEEFRVDSLKAEAGLIVYFETAYGSLPSTRRVYLHTNVASPAASEHATWKYLSDDPRFMAALETLFRAVSGESLPSDGVAFRPPTWLRHVLAHTTLILGPGEEAPDGASHFESVRRFSDPRHQIESLATGGNCGQLPESLQRWCGTARARREWKPDPATSAISVGVAAIFVLWAVGYLARHG